MLHNFKIRGRVRAVKILYGVSVLNTLLATLTLWSDLAGYPNLNNAVRPIIMIIAPRNEVAIMNNC